MEAYFRVWPEEADELKAAPLTQLDAVVAKLELDSSSDDSRPIKLFIPPALDKELTKAAARGHKKIDILLSAAHEFRRRFPQSEKLKKRPPSMENETKKGRKSVVLRLKPAERDLIQGLGKGHVKIGNRHDALVEMAKIIKEMGLPNQSRRKRVSVYLQIPDELHDAIEARYDETEIPRVRILLEAIRQRSQRNCVN